MFDKVLKETKKNYCYLNFFYIVLKPIVFPDAPRSFIKIEKLNFDCKKFCFSILKDAKSINSPKLDDSTLCFITYLC